MALAGAVVLAIAIVGKFAGAYIGARTSRLTRSEGLALGAGTNAPVWSRSSSHWSAFGSA